MKPFCFAAAVFVFTAGCTQTSPPANYQSARPGPADTDAYFLHTPDRVTPGYSTSKPPRLTVGVSDPDTQLILPWFLRCTNGSATEVRNCKTVAGLAKQDELPGSAIRRHLFVDLMGRSDVASSAKAAGRHGTPGATLVGHTIYVIATGGWTAGARI